MKSITYNSDFSHFFQTFFESEKLYKNAILFLIDRSGEIVSVYPSSPLPFMESLLNDVLRTMKTGEAHCSNDQFQLITTEICMSNDTHHFNGTLGLLFERLITNKKEALSFLGNIKLSIYSFMKREKSTMKEGNDVSEGQVDSVFLKVASVLQSTKGSKNMKIFVRSFLTVAKEFCKQDDMLLFSLFDKEKRIYYPVEATNENLLNSKNDFTLEEDTLQFKGDKEIVVNHEKVKASTFCLTHKQDNILIPVLYQDKTIGFVSYLTKIDSVTNKITFRLERMIEALGPWFHQLVENEQILFERTRKDLLLKVNRTFYSSMDVSAILEEVLSALYEAYPQYEIDLLLSHDWDVSSHLPVKPLEFNNKLLNKDYAATAYLTGEIQVDKSIITTLYVPLKGKQGVYGVFKMATSELQYTFEDELDFIQVLADTGGNALENAELYQQSKQHIANLKFINETSQQLNENLKLSEVTLYMVTKLKQNFAAEEVGFLLFEDKDNGKYETLEGSSDYFLTKASMIDLKPYLDKIEESHDAIFQGNLDNNGSQFLCDYQSLMVVPMSHNGEVIGAVVVLGKAAYSFSFDSFKLFQSFVQHATLAFVNSILHEELEKLVITDYLTKLYTREYLDRQVISSFDKYESGAFILFDIDHFKRVNDQYGHQIGDEVIIQVAKMISSTIKSKDIAARWGGEEIAIYLPEEDKVEAMAIAEIIRKKVAQHSSPHVTVSSGVSSWSKTDNQCSLKRLFQDADKALYKAKSAGRNRVES
ncbi:sensor domain-containing diguanylate cyclase [Evansella cellulosilytica]|uniref:Diguanylate cyclase n=1 Tax=Evansella cellulosilytica (strain ATCC 21833 / DSM 2522 / FERM P-1141 / JCM 9156 / N-4) TaxID=649639 RepID=E6U158_EVAC2|nr:sensor domain-containing diguanylate cyclase [Evansella cellulosilytica]ADU31504.1 diguanylate cyclase [Evansella cellulosilytica DSM 2522]